MTAKDRLWKKDKAEFVRRYVFQAYGPEPKVSGAELRRRRAKEAAAASLSTQIERRVSARLANLLDAAAIAEDLNPDLRGKSLLGQLKSIKEGAEIRGLDFLITDEEAFTLIESPCHYCGLIEKHRYNGIDRVQNNVGYIPGNVVACCRWCNHAKGTRDVEDFLAWLKWVAGSPIVNMPDGPEPRRGRPLRMHNVLRDGQIQEPRK